MQHKLTTNIATIILVVLCFAMPNLVKAGNYDSTVEEESRKAAAAISTLPGAFKSARDAARADADEDPTDPPDPVDAPLDGGVSMLVAAGVAYGVKKYKERSSKVDQ